MNQQEFHKLYEEESERIFNDLMELDEEALLDIIRDPGGGRFRIWVGSDNYQIWQVIGQKGTAKSIVPLFRIVSNLEIEYLPRYHACEALFKLAGIEDEIFMGKVQYGRDENREAVDQPAAIKKLAEMLEDLRYPLFPPIPK